MSDVWEQLRDHLGTAPSSPTWPTRPPTMAEQQAAVAKSMDETCRDTIERDYWPVIQRFAYELQKANRPVNPVPVDRREASVTLQCWDNTGKAGPAFREISFFCKEGSVFARTSVYVGPLAGREAIDEPVSSVEGAERRILEFIVETFPQSGAR